MAIVENLTHGKLWVKAKGEEAFYEVGIKNLVIDFGERRRHTHGNVTKASYSSQTLYPIGKPIPLLKGRLLTLDIPINKEGIQSASWKGQVVSKYNDGSMDFKQESKPILIMIPLEEIPTLIKASRVIVRSFRLIRVGVVGATRIVRRLIKRYWEAVTK